MAVKKMDYEDASNIPESVQKTWDEEMEEAFDEIANMPISEEERMLRRIFTLPETDAQTYLALGAVNLCRILANKITRIYLPVLKVNNCQLSFAFRNGNDVPEAGMVMLSGVGAVMEKAESSLSEIIEKQVRAAHKDASGTYMEQEMSDLEDEITETWCRVSTIRNAIQLILDGADARDEDTALALERAYACLTAECDSESDIF